MINRKQLLKQTLQALQELLTGFETIVDLSQVTPTEIYDGLVTVLLRLIFLLYAEDIGLMPSICSDNYSIIGLYEQLAADATVYKDAMAQRYGAWVWLLNLFALVDESVNNTSMFGQSPKGGLFNINTYPFLTGLEGDNIPLVADGTIYQVLRYLLIIDGDRISYRTLEVEHLGSVYESLMDYSIAVKKNSLCLVAGDERRSTGSHYTPRDLTEQIVKETLKPVLLRLGDNPTPDAILDLKICDIAMGSGAFLLESCRQLAQVLVQSWIYHGMPKDVSKDEVIVYARRLVAQKCLYGVDKNPFAVTLGKMSLWLITRSKHLPFTFLDHAIKCGDSLVGLTREQINNFTWEHKPEQLDDYLELPLF